MKATQTLTSSGNTPITIVLVVLAAAFVFAVLSGKRIPLISGDKAAILVLLLIGLAMCTSSGINRVAAANAWTHPLAILGYLVGALILIVAAAGLVGLRLPLVADSRAAFLMMAVLTGSKLAIGLLHRLL